MKNAIWRSRAAAILGFLIMLLVIFPGLPGTLKSTVLTIFGLLVMSIGLAGSRHKAYEEDVRRLTDISRDYPGNDNQAELNIAGGND